MEINISCSENKSFLATNPNGSYKYSAVLVLGENGDFCKWSHVQALNGKMRQSRRLSLAHSCQSIRQNVPYSENSSVCFASPAVEGRGGYCLGRVVG